MQSAVGGGGGELDINFGKAMAQWRVPPALPANILDSSNQLSNNLEGIMNKGMSESMQRAGAISEVNIGETTFASKVNVSTMIQNKTTEKALGTAIG